MKNIQKSIGNFFKFIFVANADHVVWIISTAVLLLIFVVFGVYSYQPDFQRSVDTLLWGTQQTAETREQLFHLPVTVVFNSSSQDQKSRMDQFLANLIDPTKALQSTDLQTKWLDYKDPEAQRLVALSGLKYLPQVFLDPVIAQHPQYKAMQQYINTKGSAYFIRLAPLEHLQIPQAAGGFVSGVDPSKAKVVIQVYESFACDHCATAQDALNKILKEYPTTVSVVYKHFEPGAVYNQIAQGADCAADQKKFPEMQARLFKGQPDMLTKLQTFTSQDDAQAYVRKMLSGYSTELKLNTKLFQTCLDDKVHEKAIEQQTVDAVDYGINGPPTFFINNYFQNGLLSYDEFKTIIDQELKK